MYPRRLDSEPIGNGMEYNCSIITVTRYRKQYLKRANAIVIQNAAEYCTYKYNEVFSLLAKFVDYTVLVFGGITGGNKTLFNRRGGVEI